jgi:GTP-binding protein HflX
MLPISADHLNGSAPQKPYAFLKPVSPAQLDLDFLALINSLEEEMTRNRRGARRAEVRDHTILVGVTTGSLAEAEESMAELLELATSAGVVVQDRIIQRRAKIDSRTVMGSGKLDELLIRALQLGADLLVFDRELQPAQVRSISEATDLKVIDRSQLILDIFAQRAQSSEGKIQVELAQLKYLLPRLVGAGAALSRLGGGIGTRGPGETKLETDRRRIRTRIHVVSEDIDQVRRRRAQLMEATQFAKPGKIRHPPFGHEFFRERGLHSVEPQNDESLDSRLGQRSTPTNRTKQPSHGPEKNGHEPR